MNKILAILFVCLTVNCFSQNWFMWHGNSETVAPTVVLTGVSTYNASCYVNITGNVTDEGSSSVVKRGIVIGNGFTPTLERNNSMSENGTGGGIFQGILTVNPSTTYYARAYAINSSDTSYSDVTTFTSRAEPTVETLDATDITATSAIIGANITTTVTVSERRMYWGYSSWDENELYVGSGSASYTFSFGTQPSTTYYYRAAVVTNCGNVYGEVKSFTSLSDSSLPTVTTTSISDILAHSAKGGGNVTSDGGATVTAKGVCWSYNPNPTIADFKTTNGSGTGSFTSNLTNLYCSTTYYVRAYATNSVGTAYGNEVSFITDPVSLINSPLMYSITTTGGTCGSVVITDLETAQQACDIYNQVNCTRTTGAARYYSYRITEVAIGGQLYASTVCAPTNKTGWFLIVPNSIIHLTNGVVDYLETCP